MLCQCYAKLIFFDENFDFVSIWYKNVDNRSRNEDKLHLSNSA